MATSSDDVRDKTVTGYPAQSGQVAAGYPAAAPAGYPYAAPPPHLMGPPPPYYNPPPPGPTRPNKKPTILCRLLVAAVAVFTIMSLFFFISWLVLRPRIPEFSVDSATVSPLNATASSLTATWDLTLLAANPNHKLAIYYNNVQAALFYGGHYRLAAAALPPFVLTKRNQTRVSFKLATVGEYVVDDVVKGITDGRNRGSVRFGVAVFASVRFRSGVFQSRTRLLRVFCERVDFGFDPPSNATGTLKGQSSPCEVDL